MVKRRFVRPAEIGCWAALGLGLAFLLGVYFHQAPKIKSKYVWSSSSQIYHAIELYRGVKGEYPRSMREMIETPPVTVTVKKVAPTVQRQVSYAKVTHTFLSDGLPFNPYARRTMAAVTGPTAKPYGDYSYLLLYRPGEDKAVGFILAIYFPGKMANWPVAQADQDAYDLLEGQGLPGQYAHQVYRGGEWTASEPLRVDVVEN